VSSTGHAPASTIAQVVPAKPPTLVFGPRSLPLQLGPGMSSMPSLALFADEPT
jgi:hypothetical protein